MRGSLARFCFASATVIALGTFAERAGAQQPPPPPPPQTGTAADIGVGPPPTQPPPGQTIVVQPATPEKPKKPPRIEKEWYGWQTIIADAASVALYTGGRFAHTESIYDVGLGTYLLATPIVHVVHGNVGPAFGSLGLRLIVPPVGYAFGFIIGLIVAGNRNSDFDSVVGGGVVGGYVGLLAGVGTVMAIDAFLLAYEKIEVEGETQWGAVAPRPIAKAKPWFQVAPVLDASSHHGFAGVRGSF